VEEAKVYFTIFTFVLFRQ